MGFVRRFLPSLACHEKRAGGRLLCCRSPLPTHKNSTGALFCSKPLIRSSPSFETPSRWKPLIAMGNYQTWAFAGFGFCRLILVLLTEVKWPQGLTGASAQHVNEA